MPNGTVRSTASLVRLRASPAPVMCLASWKATSRDQRAAYQQDRPLLLALGHNTHTADTLDTIGHPHADLGEYKQARTVWQQALELYGQHGCDEDVERVQRQLDALDQGTSRAEFAEDVCRSAVGRVFRPGRRGRQRFAALLSLFYIRSIIG
jgi:hypothetical protein